MPNKRWAILPDVHNKSFAAEKAARKYENLGYQVLFLGDYFDYKNDTTDVTERTALWLAESLKNPRRKHLMGNHDFSYAFPDHPNAYAPGWAPEKQEVIDKTIGRKALQSLALYHVIEGKDPILASHAGVNIHTIHNLPEPEDYPLDKDPEAQSYRKMSPREHILHLAQKAVDCIEAAHANKWHPLLHRGSRVGEYGMGGIFWLDIAHTSPIPGLPQIVGHNRIENPWMEKGKRSWIFHIDCGFHHAALLNQDNIRVEGITIPLPPGPPGPP